MSDALVGTPSEVAEQILARYEPLRDSRAYAEPERQQRKLFLNTSYLFLTGGVGLELALLAASKLTYTSAGFGLIVIGLGVAFGYAARRPLRYVPPEPLENLALLSQALGLCRSLSQTFPEIRIELDPLTSVLQSSCDGYDWSLRVQREKLKPTTTPNNADYESFNIVSETSTAPGRVWRRAAQQENRHRLVWIVSIEDDFTPRPGQPSPHTSLESCSKRMGRTECTFTLPISQPEQPGLGHEGRTDYISSPLGLHHPEFVGEQIACSLAWMFQPNLRF